MADWEENMKSYDKIKKKQPKVGLGAPTLRLESDGEGSWTMHQNKKKKEKTLKTDKKGALGLRPYITNMIVIIFFAICVVSFLVIFLQANNPTSDLLTNSSYGLEAAQINLNKSISEYQGITQNISKTLDTSKPAALQFIYLIFEGAFYIPKTFFSSLISTTNLLLQIVFPQLIGTGLGSVLSILSVVIFMVISISAVFLIIKAIRQGETER
jgi:hypothetical protein